jgi:hypothetical protein
MNQLEQAVWDKLQTKFYKEYIDGFIGIKLLEPKQPLCTVKDKNGWYITKDANGEELTYTGEYYNQGPFILIKIPSFKTLWKEHVAPA